MALKALQATACFLLLGAGLAGEDLRIEGQRYFDQWVTLSPKACYDLYLSSMAKHYVTPDEFGKQREFQASTMSGPARIAAIIDTDNPQYKRIVKASGEENTFILEHGAWKRTWDLALSKRCSDENASSKFEDAAMDGEAAVEVDPYDIPARACLAYAISMEGDSLANTAKALQVLWEAQSKLRFSRSKDLADMVRSTQIFLNSKMANQYYRAGRMDLATGYAKRNLTLAPELPAVEFAYGFCLMGLGDKAGAMAAFKKAYALGPDEPNLKRYMFDNPGLGREIQGN